MPDFLRLTALRKRYGATVALRDVDLAIGAGEVHALVGENGAGKSTLVKVITGAARADAGRILLDGKPAGIDTPLAAQRSGIRVVHQHLNLVPHLSVTENMLLGDLPGRAFWVDWREAQRLARNTLDELGFGDIDLQQRVGRLSLARRKLVEIAKACRVRPRLLVMDEPSAALSHEERLRLFALIDRLKAQGTAVLYISHDLDEVLQLADRITVLRDGAVVGVVRPAQTGKGQLIEMMVGRVLEDMYPRRTTAGTRDVGRDDHPALSVRRLTARHRFTDITFSLSRGEIVGLYGLVGSGRTELARALFGADPITSGEIVVDGRSVRPRSPRDALVAGIALLTEDRSRDGLVSFMSVCDNLSLPNFDRLSRFGFVQRARQGSLAQEKMAELDIRPRGIHRLVRTLSGGNQQKVALGKWLPTEAKVLVLDEPTWGVDVGAKRDIYRTIAALADRGAAVLLISSELPEVLGLADRILVMRKGRIAGEFERERATEQGLLSLAAGVDTDVVPAKEGTRPPRSMDSRLRGNDTVP